MTSNTLFHCRVTFFDRTIQDLTVFVWELEPLDEQTRSEREWIEEHIRTNYEELFQALGIKGNGGWEVVFVATMCAEVGEWHQEYGESIELERWQVQQLPSEMFE